MDIPVKLSNFFCSTTVSLTTLPQFVCVQLLESREANNKIYPLHCSNFIFLLLSLKLLHFIVLKAQGTKFVLIILLRKSFPGPKFAHADVKILAIPKILYRIVVGRLIEIIVHFVIKEWNLVRKYLISWGTYQDYKDSGYDAVRGWEGSFFKIAAG